MRKVCVMCLQGMEDDVATRLEGLEGEGVLRDHHFEMESCDVADALRLSLERPEEAVRRLRQRLGLLEDGKGGATGPGRNGETEVQKANEGQVSCTCPFRPPPLWLGVSF